MDLAEIPEADFQRHPWEVVRARFFRELLRPLLGTRGALRVLDVGAGDGYFAGTLVAEHPHVEVTCFDPGYEAVAPGVLPERPSGVLFTASEPSDSYDVVVLLDVIEHVADDEEFLTAIVRDRLRSGGHAMISVPAWPRLYSNHDVRLGHFRRYTPSTARETIGAAGLRILRRGGLFHVPLLVRGARVVGERHMRKETTESPASHALQWRSGPVTWRVAAALLGWESAVSRGAARVGLQLPGLSWWALCQKP